MERRRRPVEAVLTVQVSLGKGARGAATHWRPVLTWLNRRIHGLKAKALLSGSDYGRGFGSVFHQELVGGQVPTPLHERTPDQKPKARFGRVIGSGLLSVPACEPVDEGPLGVGQRFGPAEGDLVAMKLVDSAAKHEPAGGQLVHLEQVQTRICLCIKGKGADTCSADIRATAPLPSIQTPCLLGSGKVDGYFPPVTAIPS